jgi:hypothetical protein
MVRAVQLDSKISSGLYNHLQEDVGKLKKNITAQVSRGIASGMTFKQIAQQLSTKMTGQYKNPGGSLYYATRIARTEGHRIQCQAGMDACYKAKEKGADVVKQWDATLDGKTRNSHVDVDGQIRELDEKFSNGLMFPGDPSGEAAEVCNCRCALHQRARWNLDSGFTKMNNFTKQLETFDSPEDYAEFKKSFFSPENKKYMNHVQDMEKKYGTKDFRKVLDKMDTREYNHHSKLLENNPVFNKKSLTNTVKNSKIEAKNLEVGRSLGAKAKNYPVKMPGSNQHVKLAEGQNIQGKVFAGKGTKVEIRERFRLESTYNIPAEEWQKVSGNGKVIVDHQEKYAELHWYEANETIVEMKVKRFYD